MASARARDYELRKRSVLEPRKIPIGGNVPRAPLFESLCGDTKLQLSRVERELSSLSKEELLHARSSTHLATLPSVALETGANASHRGRCNAVF